MVKSNFKIESKVLIRESREDTKTVYKKEIIMSFIVRNLFAGGNKRLTSSRWNMEPGETLAWNQIRRPPVRGIT